MNKIVKLTSGNDGINTNEDEVPVTTINGGTLCITVSGETGEGDGIDSNGWIVMNGGTVITSACASSMDAGIDSDMGIHINGGTVIASGNMLDRISDSEQNFMVLDFSEKQNGGSLYTIRNEAGSVVQEFTPANDFSCLIYSGAELAEGTYTVWKGDVKLEGAEGENMGGRGGRPGNEPKGNPGNVPGENLKERPERPFMPDGERPKERPENGEKPKERMEFRGTEENLELSPEYKIQSGGNYFSGVKEQS